jgi:hypothetical protein
MRKNKEQNIYLTKKKLNINLENLTYNFYLNNIYLPTFSVSKNYPKYFSNIISKLT